MTTETVVSPAKWIGTHDNVTFAAALRKIKAKLRKAVRETIDTSDPEATEWPTFSHPCIEIKHEGKWILLKMPDGVTFFATEADRDLAFAALPNA